MSSRAIPRRARLICLENSRSFPESPIGGGPIVRVGDRMSVFEPSLTNDIALMMTEHEKRRSGFKWQRKLMPGGTCEATAFSTYGYRSTCLCLPLGNYHNMVDIDGVLAGRTPAQLGPEFISIADFHGLIDMLVVCAEDHRFLVKDLVEESGATATVLLEPPRPQRGLRHCARRPERPVHRPAADLPLGPPHPRRRSLCNARAQRRARSPSRP